MSHIMHQYHLVATQLKKLQKKEKQISVLEIGCAEGTLIKYLADHFKDVQFTGIDFHAPNETTNNYTLIKGKFPNHQIKNSYHIIILFNVFSLNTNKIFLNAIIKNLKVKGILIISSCTHLTSMQLITNNMHSHRTMNRFRKKYVNEYLRIQPIIVKIAHSHEDETDGLLQLIKGTTNKKETLELLKDIKKMSMMPFKRVMKLSGFKFIAKESKIFLESRHEETIKHNQLTEIASKATEYVFKKKKSAEVHIEIAYPDIIHGARELMSKLK